MALSDTARLISSLELQDKFSQTASAGEKALGGLESKSNIVTRGFGLMGQAGGAVGNAFGTLKGRIGQLISGPLGMIGLGAGLFSVGKLLTDSVGQAQDFGKEVGRLAALTGLSTETTSKLAGAFEHFGIETDQALTIVGFAEKTLGKLTATGANAEKQADDLASAQRDLALAQLKLNEATAKYAPDSSQVLAAQNRVADAQDALNTLVEDGGVIVGGAAGFFNKYGLALTDASGKIKDFNTLLLDSADFFNNKSIPAETKAAALATLYGKQWQTLIPILSAGRKGIEDAEEEAAALGLTLTKDNLTALQKLKTATRDWGTALGGLKLQLGLAVVPLLTGLAAGATNFLKSTDEFGRTGSQRIVGFFKDVIAFGEKAFGVIQDKVVPLVKDVIDGWNNLPAPLKDLLVKGTAGNFAIKFLLGFDPVGIALKAGGAVAGALAGVVAKSLGSFALDFFGKTAAQKLVPQVITGLAAGVVPVFVTNEGFGGPGVNILDTVTKPSFWATFLRFVPWFGLAALLLSQRSVDRNGNEVRGDVRFGGPRTPQPLIDNTAALNANTAALDLAREKGARGLFPFDTLDDVPREKEARGLFPFNTQDDVARERQARGLSDLADTAMSTFENPLPIVLPFEEAAALLRLKNIEDQERAAAADRSRELQARGLSNALLGQIAGKNFSPTVRVNVTTNTSVSVSNVVRTLTSYTAALGSGPGGALDPTLL